MSKKSIRLIFSALWIVIIFGVIYLPFKTPLSKAKKRELNVFAWADFFPLEVIDDFEEKTGIHVNLHHFTSNEELIVKMRATRGKGYDVVVPSDYAVKILINDGLAQPIDKTKVPTFEKITPFLLGQYYDPENAYSIPCEWEAYGFAIDSTAFQKESELFDNPSYELIFKKPPHGHKISMTPDPVEAITIAAHYLFGDVETLTPKQMEQVRNLLLDQKAWIEAYADYRAKYLISTKNCPLALLRTSFYHQMKVDFHGMEYILPNDVIFLSIENYVISKECQDPDAAYQFINAFMEKEYALSQVELCPLYPSIGEYLEDGDRLGEEYIKTYEAILANGNFKFFWYIIPENEIRKVWVDIKSPHKKTAISKTHH